MKIYLAGAISDTDRFNGQRRTAKKLRGMGYDVYAAAENDSINDKSNDPTPIDIYDGDIERVKESDVFIVRITSGAEDGTLSEIGMVSGWNEAIEKYNLGTPIQIIAYTTNLRILDPDFSQGIPSAGFNHLILGMIQRWGKFVGGEKEMLEYLARREKSAIR